MNDKEFLFKLGQKIRILRTIKDYSQEILAEKSNTDRGHICNIEAGKANPSIIYLKQIADALECDLAELLQFTI
ncbi:MAG: helix-turn-helix domain-containing protein [Candidatus Gastranaerophilales bacterium]|nr:helix-turn-helix domain-containing protein [Candidatus Gastranaerophilales bacterium]